MSDRSPRENKNTILPGYAGYLPRLKVDNHLIGKRITEQAREVFNENTLGAKNGMSSTGFNKALIPVVDQTLEATSRRFGRRTEQETSPNMKP